MTYVISRQIRGGGGLLCSKVSPFIEISACSSCSEYPGYCLQNFSAWILQFAGLLEEYKLQAAKSISKKFYC